MTDPQDFWQVKVFNFVIAPADLWIRFCAWVCGIEMLDGGIVELEEDKEPK